MAVMLATTETSTRRRERELIIAKWGWQRFDQLFPNESACIDELNRRVSKTAMCLCCYRSGWHKANISFAQAKKLRPWFAALWLYEQGIKMSVSQFADLAGVGRSTASLMLQGVAQLVEHPEFAHADASATLATAQNLIKLSEYAPTQKRKTINNTSDKKLELEDEVSKQDCSELNANESANCDNPKVSIVIKSNKPEQPTAEKAKDEDAEFLKQSVLNLLTDQPLTLDQLQGTLDAPVHLVTAATMLLELEKAVVRLPSNLYTIAGRQKSNSAPRKNATAAETKQAKHVTTEETIFEIVKSALKDIAKVLFYEVSDFLGVRKSCTKKCQQKKI